MQLWNLAPWGWVEVRAADGCSALAGETFDAIFVNAGATAPRAEWLAALSPGGRLLVPLTVDMPRKAWRGARRAAAGGGWMLRVERPANAVDLVDGTVFAASFVSPVGIFPCAGGRSEADGERLEAAYAAGPPADVRSLVIGGSADPESCWLAGDGWWLSRRSAGA